MPELKPATAPCLCGTDTVLFDEIITRGDCCLLGDGSVTCSKDPIEVLTADSKAECYLTVLDSRMLGVCWAG